jgi:hypothetical protein
MSTRLQASIIAFLFAAGTIGLLATIAAEWFGAPAGRLEGRFDPASAIILRDGPSSPLKP